jgi:hypothetical protein
MGKAIQITPVTRSAPGNLAKSRQINSLNGVFIAGQNIDGQCVCDGYYICIRKLAQSGFSDAAFGCAEGNQFMVNV